MSRRLLILCIVTVLLGGCRRVPDYDPSIFENDDGEVCNSEVGIAAPLPACSTATPCDRALKLAGFGPEEVPIVTPTNVPTCGTTDARDDHPEYDDGAPRELDGIDGTTRYYCEYDPGAVGPMPLVLWYHGSGGNADNVYDNTLIRQKAVDFDLGGPEPGFVLVSVQGRNLHWPTADPRDGSHHDVFHRDLTTDSKNPDVALADAIIDRLVDDGTVDPERIYVMGWSNGGHWSQMYGLGRHETPTPGGNRVAAIALFSAADPFHDRADGQEPSCRLDPYPKSTLPLYLVGRSCDIIPCSDAQFDKWKRKGKKVAPGTSVESWMRTLQGQVENPNATRQIIDGDGGAVDECTPARRCRIARATINHVRWPDGIADGGGEDWEVEMLEHLRENPL